ncbi:hypothetical protein EROM_071690 [Encephalitozoon romaleae SJ-2008]|uniref:Uncharacterized protein n=1 Tax=Encephalitozoon romaleae (strain SJ-2008) TaxID=1178016 RepID=I7AFD9_ENCRO|nr:hypothetical protein EROM_071690 [Encephalitozoon romaleae SJ-2008]AFN83420.1 hypothetical protein EROM_071690 [Encephalitozoon romaleae SJ-2008]
MWVIFLQGFQKLNLYIFIGTRIGEMYKCFEDSNCMKLPQLLIAASIMLLVTLIIIACEVLLNRSEESGIVKTKSRNNNAQDEHQTPAQRIIRALFRVITGMAVIKVIKGLLFPNNSKPDGENPESLPSAPPPYSAHPSHHLHQFPPHSSHQHYNFGHTNPLGYNSVVNQEHENFIKR